VNLARRRHLGRVWECPDLFEIPVRDGSGKRVASRWLLSVNLNPGGRCKRFSRSVFRRSVRRLRFTEDHPGSGAHWADWGKDFYASTSFSNIPATRTASGLPG